jgi:hypothetical protein
LVSVNWKSGTRIRMLTVTVSGLVPPDMVAQQLTMFDEPAADKRSEKQEKLEEALLTIRRKKGMDSIYRGVYDQSELGVSNRKKKRENGEKEYES